MASSPSMVFMVERREHELIAPAKPTPYEIKNLSDIDNHKLLRLHASFVLIYKNSVRMEGRDPVKMIRDAIARALVYYYPFAGRLREGANDKLIVECTGEGIMFIEADVHVRLDVFGDVLKPPFPGMHDLLYNIPGSDGILDCPLLLIQVTRWTCGGFTVGVRYNHTMTDGVGFFQFMKTVAEMACGVDVPSVQPVWRREILSARNPPIVSCRFHLYEELSDSQGVSLLQAPDLVHRSFVFGTHEIDMLKANLPHYLCQSSRFEILIAFMWRCRTISMSVNPSHEVRLGFAVNARKICKPPLPVGYYGNTTVTPVAKTTAGKLCQSQLGYAVELVKKAKSDVTDEFVKSLADLLAKRGQPQYTMERTYMVSNVSQLGDINFGWGEPTGHGPIGFMPPAMSFFCPWKNQQGEDKMVVTINLPKNAMEKLVWELERVMKGPVTTTNSSFIVSPL